jgi:membrane-bound lytic murein transglycosylase F
VSDSHILSVELIWRSDIKPVLTLNGPVAHGWAVRKDNPKLLAALNEFLEKEYKGRFYNYVYGKYFQNSDRILDHVASHQEHAEKGNISPYDAQVQKYAEEYGFDWALIVAQMYQESRFDPQAGCTRRAVSTPRPSPGRAPAGSCRSCRPPESSSAFRICTRSIRAFKPECATWRGSRNASNRI